MEHVDNKRSSRNLLGQVENGFSPSQQHKARKLLQGVVKSHHTNQDEVDGTSGDSSDPELMATYKYEVPQHLRA